MLLSLSFLLIDMTIRAYSVGLPLNFMIPKSSCFWPSSFHILTTLAKKHAAPFAFGGEEVKREQFTDLSCLYLPTDM